MDDVGKSSFAKQYERLLREFVARRTTGMNLLNTVARKVVSEYRHFGLKKDDNILSSFPKSGNTWIKFMLSELISGSSVDFSTCEKVIPYVGQGRPQWLLPNQGCLLKTHERFHRKYRRGVYIVRDGRDVAVSYYFRWQNDAPQNFQVSFSEFLNKFVEGDIGTLGSWQGSVESWQRSGLLGNEFLMIRYEDMLDNPPESLSKVVSHLGLLASEDDIHNVIARNDKERMANKEETTADIKENRFVRKAMKGDWENHFSDADEQLFSKKAAGVMRSLGYEI